MTAMAKRRNFLILSPICAALKSSQSTQFIQFNAIAASPDLIGLFYGTGKLSEEGVLPPSAALDRFCDHVLANRGFV
jgi:hypothetical protein